MIKKKIQSSEEEVIVKKRNRKPLKETIAKEVFE
jgi:hypothetical protein